MNKTVFVVSDSIGDTAKLMVKAVASKFFGQKVKINHFFYVENKVPYIRCLE
ncbi:kinase/pyrophosphorylase [Halobacillus sp. A1]|uniref:kinase/pyrophosphorylase n=1 Tax=Halobacillus sp. A1 TaxID=2880262 RepID=UPI003531DC6B|nr:kinase/pyrophosphorylase [Halobacillus sp. A1]